METPGHSVATAEAKFLLPIREAYEWKRRSKESVPPVSSLYTLLPIREAYEWKHYCAGDESYPPF